MLIYVLGKPLYAVLYGGIHRVLHLLEAQHRRTIYGRKRLLGLRRLFEEVHHLFELVLSAAAGGTPLLVHDLEKDIVLLRHIVRTGATVLDRGGEADVRRRLRKSWGIEFVILQVADDGLWGRDVSFIYFSLGSCIYGRPKMEFL